MDAKSIQQLKMFVEACKMNPQLLHEPSLTFFKTYLVSLGANVSISFHWQISQSKSIYFISFYEYSLWNEPHFSAWTQVLIVQHTAQALVLSCNAPQIPTKEEAPKEETSKEEAPKKQAHRAPEPKAAEPEPAPMDVESEEEGMIYPRVFFC